jgi:hypothetical protein
VRAQQLHSLTFACFFWFFFPLLKRCWSIRHSSVLHAARISWRCRGTPRIVTVELRCEGLSGKSSAAQDGGQWLLPLVAIIMMSQMIVLST